jgi:curved DNA-binding protein CbpA
MNLPRVRGTLSRMRDHYVVLQVQPGAEVEVIRAAYRVLARKYHPDHGGDAARMIALNDAWDVLGDPERRAAYDASRVEAAHRPGFGAAVPTPGTWAPARTSAQPGPAPSQSGPALEPDPNRAGPPPGRPSGSVLDFGRYAGWSLGEIARHDVDYLEWLQRSPSGRRLRGEIDVIVRQRRGPGPAGSSGLPRR